MEMPAPAGKIKMEHFNGRRVILASESARRQKLLSLLIPKFDIIPSSVAENANATPINQVKALAYSKAAQIAALFPHALVIGADTLVFLGSKTLGKPKDKEEARHMLRLLSGRMHKVSTGVCIICGKQKQICATSTKVRFADICDDEIESYLNTGESMDKAGAYGIQGQFSKHIKYIHGCYFNVMGLPLNTLYNMLKQFPQT